MVQYTGVLHVLIKYSGGQYFRRQTQRPRQTCYEETPVYANRFYMVTDSGNLSVYSVSAYIKILFIYTHTLYTHKLHVFVYKETSLSYMYTG